MNAPPDLKLILFKELQAILQHVVTAASLPQLNRFEAYWTLLSCETKHRPIKQSSLRVVKAHCLVMRKNFYKGTETTLILANMVTPHS